MLGSHDAAWLAPDAAGSMTPVAKGLELARRGSGADETTQARERAQALGRRLESEAVRAWLEDRSVGNLDSAPTLMALTGEYAGDGRKAEDRARHASPSEDDRAAPPADFRSSISVDQAAAILMAQAERPESRWSVGETFIAQDPGELARRLAENGIDLADDSPDRRKLGLAILRAKAGALRDIAERDRGGGIATPARPEPINLPPAPHDRRAAPGGVHRRRAAHPAARRALRLCHDAAFLSHFGFVSLRDLPDMEKLEDAGLLGRASSDAPGARLGDSALRAELAGALGGMAGEDDLEGDEG